MGSINRELYYVNNRVYFNAVGILTEKLGKYDMFTPLVVEGTFALSTYMIEATSEGDK